MRLGAGYAVAMFKVPLLYRLLYRFSGHFYSKLSDRIVGINSILSSVFPLLYDWVKGSFLTSAAESLTKQARSGMPWAPARRISCRKYCSSATGACTAQSK